MRDRTNREHVCLNSYSMSGDPQNGNSLDS